MADSRFILSCGPSRLRLITNCPRMALEFCEGSWPRSMIPGYSITPDLGQEVLFSILLIRGEKTDFQLDDTTARFTFREISPEDNKEVYFEIIFFLQIYFSHHLLVDHDLFFLKAGVIIFQQRAWLLLGGAGAGKSSLIQACLMKNIPEISGFFDGKILCSKDERVMTGNEGFAVRKLHISEHLQASKFRENVPNKTQIPLSGYPIAGLFWPRIEACTPTDLLITDPCLFHRAVGQIFQSTTYFSDGSHHQLHFFSQPLPIISTPNLHQRRYQFSRQLAQKPVWRCYGNADAMAEFAIKSMRDTSKKDLDEDKYLNSSRTDTRPL